jgi:CII-binding regulator of phage lambda lysogenization HflD
MELALSMQEETLEELVVDVNCFDSALSSFSCLNSLIITNVTNLVYVEVISLFQEKTQVTAKFAEIDSDDHYEDNSKKILLTII